MLLILVAAVILVTNPCLGSEESGISYIDVKTSAEEDSGLTLFIPMVSKIPITDYSNYFVQNHLQMLSC